MWHPFAYVSNRWHIPLLTVMVVITVAASVGLFWQGQPLNDEKVAPRGILTLEFAGTATRMKEIHGAWSNQCVLDTAKQNLYLDFGFIAIYSTTFSFLGMLAADAYRRRQWKWRALVATTLTLGQWLAAGADIMENCSLLLIFHRIEMVDVEISDFWPIFAAVCATVKFSFIAVGLLVALPALFLPSVAAPEA